VSRKNTWFALFVLFAINAMNFFDRQIPGALAVPISKEFSLSDTELGLLGTAFTLIYAVVGLPFGRLADNVKRTWLLSGGVAFWSLLTALSGAAANKMQLYLFRLGVGVGEATCAPAATALIGDLVPPSKRARAMSVFMLGLPVGTALSYTISPMIASHPSLGWRYAFYVAAIPGFICAIAAYFIVEPERGATESIPVVGKKPKGSPYWLVLSIPTMWWIIASGALHNFNMYALGSFLTAMLQRYHGASIKEAGLLVTVTYGLSGIPGLFLGGVIADAVSRNRMNGKMLVGAISMLFAVPLTYFAIGIPAGQTTAFLVLMTAGCAFMYVYYATVYATIHEVVEPALRGTAMALYFFAMYVLGAALGPYVTGAVSDHLALRAAAAAGITNLEPSQLDNVYRAAGLQNAMYIIPILCAALTVILFAGAATVGKDIVRLRERMLAEDS
jgi:MFS family permease